MSRGRTSWSSWNCPDYDNVRIIGNLLGDPEQEVTIGAPVKAVFEHHPDDDPAYTLVHWTTESD